MQSGNTVLITGASSGIGLQYAKVFAEHGFSVIMVASNTNELNDARQQVLQFKPNAQVLALSCDLSQPNAAGTLYNEIRQRNIVVDVLVNDAAFCSIGKFVETDLEKMAHMIQVYLVSTVVLTHLFATDMLHRGRGRILIMSSIQANWPSPFMAVYGACCSFLISFARALNYELKGSKISVTCVSPGPVRGTKFLFRGGAYSPDTIPRAWKGWLPTVDPHNVAVKGYYGVVAGRGFVVPGLFNWFLTQLSHWIPTSVLLRIADFLDTY
jgi:short-subunit dehydrogenase